jgi:hypothetical protein
MCQELINNVKICLIRVIFNVLICKAKLKNVSKFIVHLNGRNIVNRIQILINQFFYTA